VPEVSLSTGITKLAFITQNNHVYEYTAEGPTSKVLLNVRSPYRRQKRDLSIIRLLFRRSYTRVEVFAIISIILPSFRSHRLFPIFLFSCDHIDYFLPFYLFAIISIIKQSILTQLIKTALDLPCLNMVNNQLIRSALDFPDLKYGKSPAN
jgi:hypothetical protein